MRRLTREVYHTRGPLAMSQAAFVLRGVDMDVISRLLKDARDVPTREMLKRMKQRIAGGENRSALIIKALYALEHLEGRQRLDALELGTRDRRELSKLFEAAIQQAESERDALRIDDLLELKDLFDNPPDTRFTNHKPYGVTLWPLQSTSQ